METERLFIRRFVPDDWQDLYEYLSQEAVCKYQPYDIFTEEDAKNEADNRTRYHYWAVCVTYSRRLRSYRRQPILA